MKKLIILTLSLLAVTGTGFAQQTKLNKDTSAFAKSALYIFKLYADDKEYNGVPLIGLIDQKDIASMEILKDKKADEEYGLKGKNGVIIITLSKNVEIHQLDKLFDQYKIKQKQRTLPLYINNSLTRNTGDMFYTSSNKIKSVAIEKEKETGMKYISIITADYNPNPTPDNKFRIRGTNTSGM